MHLFEESLILLPVCLEKEMTHASSFSWSAPEQGLEPPTSSICLGLIPQDHFGKMKFNFLLSAAEIFFRAHVYCRSSPESLPDSLNQSLKDPQHSCLCLW